MKKKKSLFQKHYIFLESFSFLSFTDFCSMQPEEGDGSATDIYLYYNAAEDRCLTFRYSGHGGNPNRFINERHCMRNCSTNVENVYPTDGKTLWLIHNGQNKNCVSSNEHCAYLWRGMLQRANTSWVFLGTLEQALTNAVGFMTPWAIKGDTAMPLKPPPSEMCFSQFIVCTDTWVTHVEERTQCRFCLIHTVSKCRVRFTWTEAVQIQLL